MTLSELAVMVKESGEPLMCCRSFGITKRWFLLEPSDEKHIYGAIFSDLAATDWEASKSAHGKETLK